MNEQLHYIDDYFTGALRPEEKAAFEQRCTSDQEFARAVAFYLTARSVIKEAVHENKAAAFKKMPVSMAVAKRPVGRYLAVAATLLLLVIAGWLYYKGSPAPSKLADSYIKENLSQLSVTMSSESDSLQTGIAAYNKGDYAAAEKIFTILSNTASVKTDAIKYLGIVYLVTKRYDMAITQFDLLSQIPLYANPGPFYKALALLQRGTPEDLQLAKKLLLEVKNNQLPGSKYAVEWLNKL
ncbi:hypothetical protein SAMN05444266_106484 [Chitinophaga jiangningensis]|uniref:Tetratricopeptide repeat-containing protein n=1 Tax=Chitinophaga jiangningensis TaxID=1419482 RepID=A0A1M7GAV2_9BACT|nr:hypothetical protein [Chitinophaga jiangningensis]SHM13512.1 hypothetical protein SAMN05444266_106484 [Chitinophaga jiangningensis]